MKSANIRYMPGLDHLRAFAAIWIVLYHALWVLAFIPRGIERDFRPYWIFPRRPFTVLLQDGHTAVALFMVLSGFVFTLGCLGREVEYWPFLKNRFLRIYPLFVAVILLTVATFPGNYSFLGVLQTLLFQGNSQGALAGAPFTSMYWAVAVEFQFYLLFPFLHRFIERDGARWALGLILLALVFRYIGVLCGGNSRDMSYSHIIGRLDQFVIGMLAARVYARVKDRDLWWGTLTLASALVAWAGLMVFSVLGAWPSTGLWKIVWPTAEGLMWAMFIVSYVGFAQRYAGRWSVPLEHIGSWSYSIYLLHFALLTAIPKVVPFAPTGRFSMSSQIYAWTWVIPILLPLAALSYYVIERPFLEMRVRYLRAPNSAQG